MEISGLEEEYNLSNGKPKLIYIKKPVSNREEKLAEMLKNIRDRDGISYKYFATKTELTKLIESDLALMLTKHFEHSSNDPSIEKSELNIFPFLQISLDIW